MSVKHGISQEPGRYIETTGVDDCGGARLGKETKGYRWHGMRSGIMGRGFQLGRWKESTEEEEEKEEQIIPGCLIQPQGVIEYLHKLITIY